MPLYFCNDEDGSQYLEAYFSHFKGRRVCRHGDYVEFHGDTGGITFYGRADATLKPSGVRIGTAEIYNVVEKLPEVADSLAVGQPWKTHAERHRTETVKRGIRRILGREIERALSF
ncbi:MAG: hypothetical protein QXX57_05900 [Nitrososphaerota archaeon]